MIEVEAFANKKFLSQEEFDKEIKPYLETSYKNSRIFLRQIAQSGTTENKNYVFHSKITKEFIDKYNSRLMFDLLNGNDFLVEEFFEDESNLFLIDMFPWKDGVRNPFSLFAKEGAEQFIWPDGVIQPLWLVDPRRVIIYDIDHKWKEMIFKENKILFENYTGLVPDNFTEKLITLALSK